jgi:hypothetical protein
MGASRGALQGLVNSAKSHQTMAQRPRELVDCTAHVHPGSVESFLTAHFLKATSPRML